MRGEHLWFLACSIFFSLTPSTGARHRPLQNTNWSDADWKWLDENFHGVLDHTLPLERGTDIVVSYRSYETLQVGSPEYSLSIFEKRGDVKRVLSAHVRLPDGQPIGEQLLIFHRNHPLSSMNAAEKELTFKDWWLTEDQCPSLRAAVQKLGQVRFGLPNDKIILDPTVHEFQLSSTTGDVHAALVDLKNPLVQWGLETRRAIQVCGNPRATQSSGAR